MKKNFFSNLSLEMIVKIIAGLEAYNLFPSDAAFARLSELEKKGEQVEASIASFFEGAVLRAYLNFKQPLIEGLKIEQKYPTGSDSQCEFVRDTQSFSEDQWRPLSVFESIYKLHLRDVPVFTMMHSRGQIAMANDYREYLFANH